MGGGSATKAALGKMEYHVPSNSQLTELLAQAFANSTQTNIIDDRALKCGMRFYDQRLVFGCAVADHQVALLPSKNNPGTLSHVGAPSRPTISDSVEALVLRTCTKDPITMT